MRTRHFLVAFAAVVVSAAAAQAQDDAADVRAAIERHYTAIHANDTPAVIGHHLPDFSIFFRNGGLLLEPGFAEAMERMGTTRGFGTSNVYMNDFNAQIYGDVAVATFYLVDLSAAVDGETSFSTSRVSAVWVRVGGEWKEAHHHESPLMARSHP